jgi:hypothetical protein
MQLPKNNFSEGMSLDTQGYFTLEGQLTGRSLAEIARVMGLQQFQIADGAWIVKAMILPEIEDFDVAYQFAYEGTLEEYKHKMKQMWSLQGRNNLIRVVPTIDIGLYPPGPGIAQWLVKKPVNCKVLTFLEGASAQF